MYEEEKSTQQQGTRVRVITTIAVVLLGVFLYKLAEVQQIITPDILVPSHEIQLNGYWKVLFEDHQSFAEKDYNDSQWCPSLANSRALPVPTKLPTGCPNPKNIFSEFKSGTFWSRTSYLISEKSKIENPTLYIRGISTYGEVYLDGNLILSTKGYVEPLLVRLDDRYMSTGIHSVAIKATSTSNYRPGMLTKYERNISIMPYASAITYSRKTQVEYLIEPAVSMGIALLSMCMIFFSILRTARASEKDIWLIVQIVGTLFMNTATTGMSYSNFRGFLTSLSYIIWSATVVGYIFSSLKPQRRGYKEMRIAAGVIGTAITAFQFYRYYNNTTPWSSNTEEIKAFLILSTLCVVYADIMLLTGKKHNTADSKAPIEQMVVYTLLSFFQISLVITSYRVELKLLQLFHLPLQYALITAALAALSLYEAAETQRMLSFYGRFIRSGLKNLALLNRDRSRHEQIWRRGRQIPVLKVDIVGFTSLTYRMPYGIKRLFQHLWFSLVDTVTADHTFFDKSDGDGSLYCFDESKNENPCKTALEITIQINNICNHTFDRHFDKELAHVLSEIPETNSPWENFLTLYKERSGTGFENRQTAARFVLVYGFLDEGLWGLKAQSHYDVQGDLIILASRLEKLADRNQVIMSEGFVSQLLREDPENKWAQNLKWKSADLKGLGETWFAIIDLNLSQELADQAAA